VRARYFTEWLAPAVSVYAFSSTTLFANASTPSYGAMKLDEAAVPAPFQISPINTARAGVLEQTPHLAVGTVGIVTMNCPNSRRENSFG